MMNTQAFLSSPYNISLLGLLICAVVMAVFWFWSLKKHFLSIVDAVWAFGIGMLAVLYGILSGNWSSEKLVAVGLVGIWSLRLGFHLSVRLIQHFPKEDRRYDELRAQWKNRFILKSFLFFQFQALAQCFFAFPFAAIANATSGIVLSLFWIGVTFSLVGLIGESVADFQLKRFLSDPKSRGLVCDHGLWNYSRHPNYFFEWVIWIGFGAIGASAPGGLLSIACPVVMLLLLLFVTGVPPAEASSLSSKGKLYRDYQARTSKFIPWFSKSNPKNNPQEVL